MLTITPEYAALNRQLHDELPYYGTAGKAQYWRVVSIAAANDCRSVLDYGCGKGQLVKELQRTTRLDVQGYDPAVDKYAGAPIPADMVVCTDVLEHIEPECLRAVLDHIGGLTRKLALFQVSTKLASKTLPDGRNAHLLVKPWQWWADRIASRYGWIKIKYADDEVLLCLCKPYQ